MNEFSITITEADYFHTKRKVDPRYDETMAFKGSNLIRHTYPLRPRDKYFMRPSEDEITALYGHSTLYKNLFQTDRG